MVGVRADEKPAVMRARMMVPKPQKGKAAKMMATTIIRHKDGEMPIET